MIVSCGFVAADRGVGEMDEKIGGFGWAPVTTMLGTAFDEAFDTRENA